MRPMLIETLGQFEREISRQAVAPVRRPAVSGFGRKS